MHVTILSRKLAIYTTRRLAQAARLRGARVRVLDPLGRLGLVRLRRLRADALTAERFPIRQRPFVPESGPPA